MEILSAAYRRHAIIIVMIFVICILIECLICNANAFRLKNNGDYKQKTYTLQDLKITNAEVDMDNGKIIYNNTEHSPVLSISTILTPRLERYIWIWIYQTGYCLIQFAIQTKQMQIFIGVLNGNM